MPKPFAVVHIFCFIVPFLSSVSASSAPVTTAPVSPGPYCGIYCVYAAEKLITGSASFEDFLQPQYIGSVEGSSIDDLERAARAHSLHAEAFENLSITDLENSPYPMILHVKGVSFDKEYNHWVLFARTEGGRAFLLDPYEGSKAVEFSDLCPRWDGAALVIAAQELDTEWLRNGRMRIAGYVGLGVFCCLLARRNKRLEGSTLLPTRGIAFNDIMSFTLILAFVAMLSLAYNSTAEQGLLKHSHLVTDIQLEHTGDFVPNIDAAELERSLQLGRTIIDARAPLDFARGHIPGAMNLPANTPFEQYHLVVDAVDKESLVIVYCENRTCPFSGKVATGLVANGFRNVVIFKDGWAEWRRRRS